MGRINPDRERRITTFGLTAAVGVVLLLGALAVGVLLRDAALGGGESVDCDNYEFSPGKWRGEGGIDNDAKELEAEALVRCETLIGMTRSEVTEMLGAHRSQRSTSTPGKWSFDAGWVNDAYGPGDGQLLRVHFGPDGEVAEATLAY